MKYKSTKSLREFKIAGVALQNARMAHREAAKAAKEKIHPAAKDEAEFCQKALDKALAEFQKAREHHKYCLGEASPNNPLRLLRSSS